VKAIALTICEFWWAIGSPGRAQTGSPDAFSPAASAFQQGNLEAAEQTLRAAVASQADRPDLLGLLAVVLDAKKEYEQAEQFHRRALRLAPGSAGLWNNLGNHYLARGKDDEARAAFLRVIALDTEHTNANPRSIRSVVVLSSVPRIARLLVGLKNIKESPSRLDAVRKAFEAAGVTLKEFYMVMGHYDMVIVTEAPDEMILARAILTLTSKGNIQTETLRAFSEGE